MTNPASLFITLMDKALEIDGDVYPIEQISQEGDKVVYEASFPLSKDLEVNGMTYLTSEHKLVLELKDRKRTVTLESFDHMMHRKASEFATVDLTADISHLSDQQKEMLKLLFQVADLMEEIYWAQVFPKEMLPWLR